MSNEITAERPSSAIQILQAKIEAFNKQWQGYNQNWTNISDITLPTGESIYNKYGVTLTFLGETIKYGEKIIVEWKNDKLYYYLYNLPNHFGIRIIKKDAVCYSIEATEGQLKEDKRFSVGDLIYRDGDNFIITKEPRTSGYYFTINPINKRWIATYKPAFLTEVGNTFDFNFMQRLDSPYTYFSSSIASAYRDHVIDANKTIFNYCGENYGMEAPFHLYTMKKINKREGTTVISSTYEEIYDDQTWYFNSQVESGILKNNLVILHEKPVAAGPFYQLVR